MNNQIGNKINDKTYIPLPPFKGWVLENFPFIEDDFDCLTNYQMLCLMFKKLNEVIANQNTVQELGSELVVLYNALVDAVNSAINEFETEVTADINQFKIDTNTEISNFETFITGKFNELKDYVDNFFDNNFPEMVSDKLDEMASDGTLENLLNDTAHLTKSYNTYTDMMADSSVFTNGLRLKTLGYYSINDGGGADYYVNNSVITTNYQIDLQNGLYLNLNNNYNKVYPEQFGAYGDNTHDDSTPLINAFNYCVNNDATLILNKEYNIATDTTLDGNAKRINIECNGYLKPTNEISITNIINSKIKIKLKNGGNNDSSENGVIFSKLKYCHLDLLADSVKKTAFNVYSSRTANNTCNWCTIKLKGTNNTKTLFHGVTGYTVPDNGAFGCYEDIEDHNPSEPITFRSSSDVTILHFENEFNDATWLKNSLEFLYCGIIHCGTLACGANAKNLIYSINSRLFIDNVFVLAEDKTNGEVNIPSNVTGIYATGVGSIKINNITNHGCKYAIDMSTMADQACKDSYIYNVYNVVDAYVDQRRGGIYCPKISNDIMYTYSDLEKGVIDYSSYLTYDSNMSINNYAIVKNANEVNIYLDFNVNDNNIAQNTSIIFIDTSLLKESLNSSGIIFDRTNNTVKGVATLAYNSFQIRTQTALLAGNRYSLNISFYIQKSKLQHY